MQETYVPLSLGGRGRTGSDSSGSIFHAVAEWNGQPQFYGHSAALCGKKPGRRSIGWSTWMPSGQQITCPLCAKKLTGVTGAATAV